MLIIVNIAINLITLRSKVPHFIFYHRNWKSKKYQRPFRNEGTYICSKMWIVEKHLLISSTFTFIVLVVFTILAFFICSHISLSLSLPLSLSASLSLCAWFVTYCSLPLCRRHVSLYWLCSTTHALPESVALHALQIVVVEACKQQQQQQHGHGHDIKIYLFNNVYHILLL